MKRNLFLLLSVVSLITFIYYYHEVGDKKRIQNNEDERKLFNPSELGSLQSFSTIKTSVYKNEQGHYYINDSGEQVPVDERKVQALFDALSHIRFKRELPLKEVEKLGLKLFFTTEGSEVERISFSFKEAKVRFVLGKKLDFDQSFYMKVIEERPNQEISERYIIAFDGAHLNVPVTKERYHRTDVKYRRFQSLLYLDQHYFRDYRLLSHWLRDKESKWTLKKIAIDNKRNRNYQISFVDKQTVPAPPSFISIATHELRSLEKEIVLLEGISLQKKLKSKEGPLATASISSSKGEVTLSLLSTGKGSSKKIWLKSSYNGHYYEVSSEVAKIFLGSVQRFWQLRLAAQIPQEISIVSKKKKVVSDELSLRTLVTKEALYLGEASSLEDPKKLFDLNWGMGDYSFLVSRHKVMVLHEKTKLGLVYGKDDLGGLRALWETF